MKNVKNVLSEVLEEIKPDKDYEKNIFEKIDSIIKKINKSQKNIKAVLGGSGAKGTWLKTFDADIFVLFNYKKYMGKNDKLSEILEKILKKNFKSLARIHGSRDYFQIKNGNFTFEIVPILEIKNAKDAVNITDVSPLHARWVKKHKKIVNDMKLTKQFCTANNIYGAESHVRGFSGYVCEILSVYYGSFLNLAKNAAKWNDKTVVDVEKYYKGKDVFRIVNTSKLASPLIVIDPVQKDRNAAAAISIEKFELFKKRAAEFLKITSKEFFVKKNINEEFLKLKHGKKLVKISCAPLEGKIDVVGSKIFKIFEFIKQKCKERDFNIIKSDWEFGRNESCMYFLFEDKKLPESETLQGPPVELKVHVDNFRKMHRNTFVKSGKIFAREKRKFSAAEGLIKEICKSGFVKEKTKSVKIFIQ